MVLRSGVLILVLVLEVDVLLAGTELILSTIGYATHKVTVVVYQKVFVVATNTFLQVPVPVPVVQVPVQVPVLVMQLQVPVPENCT